MCDEIRIGRNGYPRIVVLEAIGEMAYGLGHQGGGFGPKYFFSRCQLSGGYGATGGTIPEYQSC